MMANFQIVHSNVRCSVRLSGQVIIMACYSKTMTAYQVRRCLPVCDSYNTLCPTFKSHKRKGADQHVIPVSFTGSQITTSLLRRSFDLEIVTQTQKFINSRFQNSRCLVPEFLNEFEDFFENNKSNTFQLTCVYHLKI